jgi:hypothetical protein
LTCWLRLNAVQSKIPLPIKLFFMKNLYTSLVFKTLFIAVFTLFFAGKSLADYTINAGQNIDASTITGQSGVLTINGTLTISSDVSLSGFTSVIITCPGEIFWSANKTLTFAAGTSVEVNNYTTGSGCGLQPEGLNAAMRLTIGSITIAVSNTTSNNAAYSFAEFNNAGGLAAFTLTGSSSICYTSSFSVTLTPTDNIVPFNCTWTVDQGGSPSPFTSSNFTGPVTYTVTPTNSTTAKTYTVTATIARKADKQQDPLAIKTFQITVNPTPSITSATISVCTGSGFTVTPANGGSDVIPSGTTYGWSIPTVTGGLTGGAAGSNASSVTGTLANPTNAAQTATYTVTPNSGTCTGTPFTVTATINPTPAITAITSPACSGSGFTVSPADGTNGVVPTGVTYSWSAPTVTGGLTGGAAGTNVSSITGTLTDPTTTAQTATYAVTPKFGTCTGSPFNVTATVNPLPTAAFSGSTSIASCYGSTANLSMTGTPNATINYTMNGVAQTPVQLDASGNYTLTSGAITGTTTYVLTGVTSSAASCAGSLTATTATLSVTSGSYTWTGLKSNDWNDLSNWCSGAVPALVSSVSIPSGTPFSPVIKNANANAGSIVIANGATVTMTGNYNLTVASGSSFTNNGSFDATASTGAVIFAGSGAVNGSTASTFTNVTTNGALTLTTAPTINNSLTINTGGSVITNAPVYGSAATLIYNTTTATLNTGMEWTGNSGSTGAGAPYNVTVQNANSVVLSGSRTVPGTLTVATGNSLDINSNTLTVNTAFSGTGKLRGSTASGLVTSGAGTVYFSSSPYNQLKTLSVNSGGNLTLGGNIASGDTLNIVAGNSGTGYGTVTANGILNTGNLLALKSDANGTATVAASSGVISDTVTVERYFPALRAWRFLAVPFGTTNQTINSAWQEGWVNSVLQCPSQYTGTPGYGTEISGGSSANGFDINNTGYASLKVYQNNSWAIPSSTYSNLVTTSSNNAYALFVRGDRNVCLNYTAPPGITTLRTRGILNQRSNGANITVNFSGAKPGDFIFIGNPYAAPLDIETAVKTRNVGISADQFLVWNPTLGGTMGVGGYVTFSNGLQVPYDLSNDTTNYAANTIIQSGEAFMVQVNSANVGGAGSITFKETDKSSTEKTTGVFGFKGTSLPKEHRKAPPALYINVLGPNNVIADGVGVGFGNRFSTYKDPADVQKKWNEEIENMAIVKRDTTLAIDFRPVPKDSDSVQLRLYLRQQPYTLQIFMKGIRDSLPAQLWLVDKYLGTRTRLDLYSVNLYNFTPNRDTNSYRNRFIVAFNRKPRKQGQDRGTITNTQAIADNDLGSGNVVSVYPNPVNTGKATLRFNNMPAGSYEMAVYNGLGERLSTNTIVHTGNNTVYPLEIPSSWPSGIYNVHIVNAKDNRAQNVTFVIRR